MYLKIATIFFLPKGVLMRRKFSITVVGGDVMVTFKKPGQQPVARVIEFFNTSKDRDSIRTVTLAGKAAFGAEVFIRLFNCIAALPAIETFRDDNIVNFNWYKSSRELRTGNLRHIYIGKYAHSSGINQLVPNVLLRTVAIEGVTPRNEITMAAQIVNTSYPPTDYTANTILTQHRTKGKVFCPQLAALLWANRALRNDFDRARAITVLILRKGGVVNDVIFGHIIPLLSLEDWDRTDYVLTRSRPATRVVAVYKEKVGVTSVLEKTRNGVKRKRDELMVLEERAKCLAEEVDEISFRLDAEVKKYKSK